MLAGVAIALAGCAAMTAPQEKTVKALAQERWDDLVKGDYRAAYRFLSPGSKSVASEEKYVAALRKDFWKAARVDKVECPSPEACDVTLTIEYEYMGRRTKTPLVESWVREGSDWWYVQK
jgi:hypothetical protein